MQKSLSVEDTEFVTENLLINYLLWDDNELLKNSFVRNNHIQINFDPENYYFCITGLNKKYNDLHDADTFNYCRQITQHNYDQYYQLLQENHYSGNILLIKPDNSKQIGILFSPLQDPLCSVMEMAEKIHRHCLKLSFVRDNLENRLTTSLSGCYHGLENIHLAYNEARELNNLSFFNLENKVLNTEIISQYKKQCDVLLINENIRKLNQLMCTGSFQDICRQVEFIYFFQIRKSLNYDLFQLANSLVENVLLLLANVYDVDILLRNPSEFENLEDFVSYLKKIISQILEVRNRNTSYSYDIILVLSYIKSNFGNSLSLQQLSDYVGVSSTYLSRQFNNQIGMSLPDYINQFKVQKAKELLAQTEMPVTEISNEVGFDSPRYFSQIFKKHCGCTPQTYRSSKQERE